MMNRKSISATACASPFLLKHMARKDNRANISNLFGALGQTRKRKQAVFRLLKV